MSTADNKALVTKFWEAFSASKFDDALAMLSDDATWWVAGTTALSGKYTKPEFAALLGNVTGSAPQGILVTPKQLTAEDNRVSVGHPRPQFDCPGGRPARTRRRKACADSGAALCSGGGRPRRTASRSAGSRPQPGRTPRESAPIRRGAG